MVPKSHDRIIGVVLGLLILVSCSKRNEEEGSWSHLKVDTLIVDREVILRDTVLIEKEVEVPAEIPEEYKRALEKFNAEDVATTATESTVFSGVDRLYIKIFLDEVAEDIISEQRVRDKFELLLRGYGIPVFNLDNSTGYTSSGLSAVLEYTTALLLKNYISLSINAGYVDVGYQNDIRVYIYTTSVNFRERVIFYRDEKPYREDVILWEHDVLGYAGSRVIEDALLENIEEYAERVANLYLSVNPR